MHKLKQQLSNALCQGMKIPNEIDFLFTWIENNKYFTDMKDGLRSGTLFPILELRSGWKNNERPGGTIISFHAEGNKNLKHWFGHDRNDVLNRLCVFAQTGADGSMAAFWLDPHGQQKIVHLGSGSGSLMTCVLTDNPIDFLRLLAIGYDEICWGDLFDAQPNTKDCDLIVHNNARYVEWVKKTFSVDIPNTGIEIVKNVENMGCPNPKDEFNKWIAQNDA